MQPVHSPFPTQRIHTRLSCSHLSLHETSHLFFTVTSTANASSTSKSNSSWTRARSTRQPTQRRPFNFLRPANSGPVSKSRSRTSSGTGRSVDAPTLQREHSFDLRHPEDTMSDNSAIEWTDATWNPVTGCNKVSPGCKHCYAETFSERFRGVPGHPFEQGFDLRLWPARLNLPLRWRTPRRIFVNSMSDLFHERIPDDFIESVFETMRLAYWHQFQVLT